MIKIKRRSLILTIFYQGCQPCLKIDLVMEIQLGGVAVGN